MASLGHGVFNVRNLEIPRRSIVTWRDLNQYLRDPDGNEVELFVDDPGVGWRRSWK